MMIDGLGSLPPEYRHMHGEIASGEDQIRKPGSAVCVIAGTLSPESAAFVPRNEGCRQGSRPQGDQSKSGDLKYGVHFCRIIGTAILVRACALSFVGTIICTRTESLTIPMQM